MSNLIIVDKISTKIPKHKINFLEIKKAWYYSNFKIRVMYDDGGTHGYEHIEGCVNTHEEALNAFKWMFMDKQGDLELSILADPPYPGKANIIEDGFSCTVFDGGEKIIPRHFIETISLKKMKYEDYRIGIDLHFQYDYSPYSHVSKIFYVDTIEEAIDCFNWFYNKERRNITITPKNEKLTYKELEHRERQINYEKWEKENKIREENDRKRAERDVELERIKVEKMHPIEKFFYKLFKD